MSATISMWLGIAFLAIGVVATVLQAWLWRFPMMPDPGGPDPNGKSSAPRSWTHVHRALGAAFVVIYVIMMIQMTPRLWEYQVELPARSILHAVMGITIGFLLVLKIAIIRWFQHFGKALPKIGAAIMLCTIILSFLSVPYALRAQDFGSATTPAALERVKVLTAGLELGEAPETLATAEAMHRGREVLTVKCVVCHDLRTILRRPYTPEGWRDVVWRMMEKPQIERAMKPEDLAPVTAYLIAITPDLQVSAKRKRESEVKRRGEEVAVEEDTPEVDEGVAGPSAVAAVASTTRAADADAGAAGDAGVGDAGAGAAGDAGAVGAVGDAGAVGDVGAVSDAGAGSAQADAGPSPEAAVVATQPAVPVKKKGIDLEAPGAMARAKSVYVRVCSSCHGLEETERYGKHTEGGWRALIRRMNTDNDAGVKPGEVALIAAYLAKVQGK